MRIYLEKVFCKDELPTEEKSYLTDCGWATFYPDLQEWKEDGHECISYECTCKSYVDYWLKEAE